jgi:hypothetical protein
MRQFSPSSQLPAIALLLSVSVLFVACAQTSVDRTAWIQVGKTTRSEVVAQYGEPDLVLTSPDGETVTYRPAAVRPSVQIPTAQPGPLGTSRTQTETIEPGLGRNDRASRRPTKEVRIRYNAQGVVQDVME